MADSCNVRVYARFRPLNQREQALGEQATKGLAFKGSTDVTCTGHAFSFDGVFGPDSQQEGIYQAVAASTVDDLFVGFNGTIFAYGQTGAGKSFTMMGVLDDGALAGVIPRATRHIFATIDEAPTDVSFKVSVSYLEVYREVIRDLLDTRNTNLAVRESKTRGTYVEGCATIGVATEAEVHQVIQLGDAARAVGATNMNAHSSRSHCIVNIGLEKKNTVLNTKKNCSLNLVDLAGSEKIKKTNVVGDRLKEAQNINLSLTTLGICISRLASEELKQGLKKKKKADGAQPQHVPFRDSKLTRMLQNSLGGNARTLLLVAMSPHEDNRDETNSTLEFARRAKHIKNVASVNKNKKQAKKSKFGNSPTVTVDELKEDQKEAKALLTKVQDGLAIVQDADRYDRDVVREIYRELVKLLEVQEDKLILHTGGTPRKRNALKRIKSRAKMKKKKKKKGKKGKKGKKKKKPGKGKSKGPKQGLNIKLKNR